MKMLKKMAALLLARRNGNGTAHRLRRGQRTFFWQAG